MIHSIKRLFEKPELWLVRMVLVASAIAVVYYSSDKAKDVPTQIILVCLGLSAVGFHYIGAKKACAAWFDRSPGRIIAWSLVICGAVLWEVNGQLGVGSQNQSNLTQAMATNHANSESAQRRLAVANDKLKTLTSEQAYRADVKPANAYDADIAQARAHRFWGLTNACTETKGPQTRGFCDAFRKAESDQALAVRKAELAGLITKAEAEVAEARAGVSATGVVASAVRSDFKSIRRLTNLENDDIEIGQTVLMVLVMALFLTVAGWLIKAEEYEGKPRKPWFNTEKWKAMFMGEGTIIAPANVQANVPANIATTTDPRGNVTVNARVDRPEEIWKVLHDTLNGKRVANAA